VHSMYLLFLFFPILEEFWEREMRMTLQDILGNTDY